MLTEKFQEEKLLAANTRRSSSATTTQELRLPAAVPARADGRTEPTASSSTATPPRRSARVYAGATVGAWYPITPSTSLMDGVQGLLREVPRRQGDGQEQLRHPAGRGRAVGDRHGDRRVVGRRALLHRHLGPGHLADERVHRAGVLRRDPGGLLRRAALRPLDRHADAHAAGRPLLAAPMPRTATPSTCSSALPGQPARVLRLRCRPSTSPSASRRRSSCCPTSTSA
jgi:hypothetical protein